MIKKSHFTRLVLFTFVLLSLIGASTTRSLAAPAEAVAGCKQIHIVQSGEYLTKIASIYGVSWRAIADLNKLEDYNRIFPGQSLSISTTSGTNVPTTGVPSSSGAVRVYATSVVEDKTVVLQGKNLDAKATYTVYMSNYKLLNVMSYPVGFLTTDANGTFSKTFNIPKRLVDVAMVKVLLVSRQGDTATNWFINSNVTGNTGGIGAPAISLRLVEVKSNGTVRITASNMPAKVTFSVYVGKADTKGVGGVLVGKMVASNSGKVTATFEIPDKYQDNKALDIRIESQAIRMDAYLNFNNNTK
jgi:LysM repeat protein